MSAAELGTGPGFCVYRLFNAAGQLLFRRVRTEPHPVTGSFVSRVMANRDCRRAPARVRDLECSAGG
jgi:hypothetical protein